MSLDFQIGRIVHPGPVRPFSLFEALEQCDQAQDIKDPQASFRHRLMTNLAVYRRAISLARTPIIGVCGTVNSGKSTIVASFLSEGGRARVPIGTFEKDGTNRFVYWLPQRWKRNGLAREIESLIQTSSGFAVEHLSEDPVAAAIQYNAAENRKVRFNIPLVAFDEALDEAGLALLDCPDIQRSLDEGSDLPTASLRLERLKAIAPTCSGFVVVSSMEQSGTEDVGRLFNAMRDVAKRAPVYFVLNKTHSTDPEVYGPEVNQILSRWGQKEFVKEIFISPFVQSRVRGEKPNPVILSLGPDLRPLGAAVHGLDIAEMQSIHAESSLRKIEEFLDEVKKSLEHSLMIRRETHSRLQDDILTHLTERLLDHDGRLRAPFFFVHADAFRLSFRRTAPRWRYVLSLPMGWIKRWMSSSDSASNAQVVFLTASDFGAFMHGRKSVPPMVTRDELQKAWSVAWDIAKNCPNSLFPSDADLDVRTKQIWDLLSKKGNSFSFKSLSFILVGLSAGVFMAPVDGGFTAIKTSSGIVLSITEILGSTLALTAGGSIAYGSSLKRLQEEFDERIAKPQIRNLYDALCDCFGLPRKLGNIAFVKHGQNAIQIDPSDMPIHGSVTRVFNHVLFEIDESLWRQMRIALKESVR